MKLSRVAGLVPWVVIASATFASAGDPTFKPKLKYKTVGDLKAYDSPAAACQSSAAMLSKSGNKNSYVGTKDPDPEDFSITCVLKDSDGKNWDQTDNITIVPDCGDPNISARSEGNTGTLSSQVCPCAATGCPVPQQPTQTPPPPPPVNADCLRWEKSKACKRKTSPPGVDRSARCTQQPKPSGRRSKEDADKISAENIERAERDSELVRKYNAEKRKVARQELEKKRQIYGRKLKSGFPDFSGDLCPGINDVNIGKLCGADDNDFAAANNISGRANTPPGCTWHHHEDMGRMQLVRTRIHGAKESAHWGGRSIWTRANDIDDYPKCCP